MSSSNTLIPQTDSALRVTQLYNSDGKLVTIPNDGPTYPKISATVSPNPGTTVDCSGSMPRATYSVCL